MMRYVPLVLAFLASLYVGFLFSPDAVALLTFSIIVLLTLTLALLIRLAWSNSLYGKFEGDSGEDM
jgi:hypothetical protein